MGIQHYDTTVDKFNFDSNITFPPPLTCDDIKNCCKNWGQKKSNECFQVSIEIYNIHSNGLKSIKSMIKETYIMFYVRNMV